MASDTSGSADFRGFSSEELKAAFDKHTEQNRTTNSTSSVSEMNSTDILSSSNSEEKGSTVIKSDVTIVTENRTIKSSTEIKIPPGGNVFLAIKGVESFFDKLEKLS